MKDVFDGTGLLKDGEEAVLKPAGGWKEVEVSDAVVGRLAARRSESSQQN